MKFLIKVFLFALLALAGLVSAQPEETNVNIKNYKSRCQKHGMKEDCWVTGPTTAPSAKEPRA
uniref:Uncharacterized protein n=1 Tax=Anopheles quadriannulatus TaxID=34691 RepID=A0A182XR96_ANOQN